MMKRFLTMLLSVMLVLVMTAPAESESISVKKITLSDKTVTLAVGTTWELSAEISPDDATDKMIIWSSSNDNIATVDENGIITGIGKGNAKITAISNDGKVKAQATVKVNEYDLVFTDTEPQSEKYYYKPGSFTVKGTVKKGCVSIDLADTRIISMSSSSGLHASDPFTVTPEFQGEDIITVKAGKQKTTITVYVSQKTGRELDAQRTEKEKELAEKAERSIKYSGCHEYVKALFSSKDKDLGIGKPKIIVHDEVGYYEWGVEKVRITYLEKECEIGLVGYNNSGHAETCRWGNIKEKKAIAIFCALCERLEELHSKLLEDQELEISIYTGGKGWYINDTETAMEFLEKYKK